LTTKDLCEQLSIDRRQLAAWIRGGLPWSGSKRRKQFDADAVARWLIDTGNAEPLNAPLLDEEQQILRTVGQVAQHFNVSHNAVWKWLNLGCPGRPGSRGKQEGFFSVPEIEAWLDARRMTGPEDDIRNLMHARLHKARATLIELEVAKKRSELVNSDDIRQAWAGFLVTAKAELGTLAARLTRGLPRRIVRKQKATIERHLVEVYRTLELPLRHPVESGVEHNGSPERTKGEGQPDSD
jgi:phage terminase Nu1 subunit (DNA packaging protein)